MSEQEHSLTIKAGAPYDRPQVTLRGTAQEIREGITEVFGFDVDDLDGKTTAELSIIASLNYHALASKHLIGGTGAKEEDDPISKALRAASSLVEMREVYSQYENKGWDDRVHGTLANEIKKERGWE